MSSSDTTASKSSIPLSADFDGCIRSDCVGDFGECLAFGVSRSFSAEGHSEWQQPFLRKRAGSSVAENGEECDEDVFHGVFGFLWMDAAR